MPSPQRSLGHSLFKQKFSQKFLCFFVLFCFFVFCVFYFIKISKFALPGVMLIYERTSKDRKKEHKRQSSVETPIISIYSESSYDKVELPYFFSFARRFSKCCLRSTNHTTLALQRVIYLYMYCIYIFVIQVLARQKIKFNVPLQTFSIKIYC